MTEAATIGHNLPPQEYVIKEVERQLPACAAEVNAFMRDRHKDVFARAGELLEAAKAVPAKCDDETTAEKISDLKRQLSAAKALADNARKIEKKPWTTIGDSIHNLFEQVKSRIDEETKRLATIHTDWMERVAAAKRAAAEAEARRLREESERQMRAAAEAEARRREAEAAAAKAKADAEAAEARKIAELKAAEEARRRADQAKADAAAAAVREKEAEERRKAAEAKAKIDAEAAAEQLKLAEAQKVIAQAERAKADAERRAADEDAAKARAAADASREEQRAAEGAAKAATAVARGAAKDERTAMDDAVRQDKKADKQEDVAGGSMADLSRHRGEHSVSSLQTVWEFRHLDRGALDLEALRPFIALDALEVAIRAYIRAGNRTLKGVQIYEDVKGQTR